MPHNQDTMKHQHAAPRTLLLATLAAAVAGCATDPDAALDADDVAVVARQDQPAPAGCQPVRAIVRPIAAPHFHDPALRQTAGKLTMRVGATGVRTGTSLATIVGQTADGGLLGDHDLLFADAGFRTRDDKVALAPRAGDASVFDTTSQLNVVEGTGAYAGLTGTLDAVGYVDFCGAAGRIEIRGFVCPAGDQP
jgi:hypothetical protein